MKRQGETIDELLMINVDLLVRLSSYRNSSIVQPYIPLKHSPLELTSNWHRGLLHHALLPHTYNCERHWALEWSTKMFVARSYYYCALCVDVSQTNAILLAQYTKSRTKFKRYTLRDNGRALFHLPCTQVMFS